MIRLLLAYVVLATYTELTRCFLFPSLVMRNPSLARAKMYKERSVIEAVRLKVHNQFKLTMLAEAAAETTKPAEAVQESVEVVAPIDAFFSYKVGQEYTGNLTKIKKNGAQINFTATESAIIPKSRMSIIDFEKLKGMHQRHSQEQVTVEIIDINVLNRTMYAKYTDKTNTNRADLSVLAAMDPQELRKLRHNATVVSANENGVYIQFDEYAIAGFVGTEKLPNLPPPAHVSKLYT